MVKEVEVDEATHRYVDRLFAPRQADLLRTMAARAKAAGMPAIMISEEQAQFLHVFLRAVGARRCLDVGTLFGFSAAVMAHAVGPAGRVLSLEMDPRHARIARANLKSLGLGRRVRVLEGPALAAMRSLPPASLDFVLIDADKGNYTNYLEEAIRLVRPGGAIAADNAFGFGLVAHPERPEGRAVDVQAIREFNAHVARHPLLDATILPIGDGLALMHVRKPSQAGRRKKARRKTRG